MTGMGPSAFLGYCDDGVCSGSPEFLGSLEDVAFVEFAVGGD